MSIKTALAVEKRRTFKFEVVRYLNFFAAKHALWRNMPFYWVLLYNTVNKSLPSARILEIT